MLTPEQLAARKIGGSSVATILGINPYQTKLQLYHEMRGTLEREDLSDNEAVEAGNVLEDGIAELTALHMSRHWGREVKLRRSNLTTVNPDYPWLTIHVDRVVAGQERGVEIKNVGARAAREWGAAHTDDIPTWHLCQVHTYMLVKDYPFWTVAAYFGGADLRLYEVARNATWDEIIISDTEAFWRRVVDGDPPPIDYDTAPEAAVRLLKRLYPGTDGTVLACPQELEASHRMMARYQRVKARAETREAAAKARLLHHMKNAGALRFDDGTMLVRRRVARQAYTVKPTEYMDARLEKAK